MKKFWTIREVNFLKANYKKHSDAKTIAATLNRPLGGVHQKIHELQISIPTKIAFTEEEKLFLKCKYKTLSNKELATALRKTLTVVRNMMYSMKLQRFNQKDRAWLKHEDEILSSSYKTTGDTDIARMLPGRTKGGVRKRRLTLDLIRNTVEVENIVASNKPRFLKHSFKPGEKRYKNNMAKAWRTRNASHEEIISSINKRMQTAA
jgi:hypothetical protein